ncbi:MAG: hypothetical protein KGS72_10070 [Cyanobacteria bacterium REEB67]|nr:hypothetical protein [Cyanobacteria bacterium REEB67]
MSAKKLIGECVVVDLDGTLADAEHRMRYYRDGKLDWAHFEAPENIPNDQLHHIVAEVVKLLRQKWPIIYVSGRKDTCYDVTVDWLKKHDLWHPPALLLMRNRKDSRHDYEVKKDILDELIGRGYRPILSLDDRNSVVQMWRDNGIPCFQVADGDF